MRISPTPLPSQDSDADGEALCSKVAQAVMGWESVDIPWAYDGTVALWQAGDGDPVMTVFSWRPDRNDAQTMQVLDRMIDRGFELTLTVRGDHTVARFARERETVARSEARERRMALLNAALAAVEAAPDAMPDDHGAAG